MFEQITIERGHCTLCNAYGLAVSLPLGGHPQLDGPLVCERCLRASVKAADVLRVLRVAKSPKGKRTPNKTRKPASEAPRSTEPYRGPSKHEVGSLVPAADPELS